MKRDSKKSLWVISLVLCFGLIFITYRYYKLKIPLVIESSYVVDADGFSGAGALSPDGNKLFTSLTKYYTLEDGKIQDNIVAFEAHARGARGFLSVSPDSRFMTAGDMFKNYLLDLEQKTYRDDGFLCKSWSNDGLRCIDIRGNLIDILENREIENWDDNVNFNKVKDVSANGDYLWDNQRQIPIAHIFPCPIREPGTGETLDNQCKLVPPSVHNLDQVSNGLVEFLLEVNMPNSVADWTFDPSGKFVLFAIWERKPGDYSDSIDFTSNENVKDTRLVLIDWRTKRSIELTRLSQIAPDYPVSSYFGNMQWSADSNTIFIPLYDGKHYLVLKVKYP